MASKILAKDIRGSLSAGARAKSKIINLKTWCNILWKIARVVLLIGLSYIILQPFIVKISYAFMSDQDIMDNTVKWIPKNPTMEHIDKVIRDGKYYECLKNTISISVMSGVVQMLICTMIGYGFAKFKFKGSNLLFLLVIFTMIIPPQTVMISMFMQFRFFDVQILPFLPGPFELLQKAGVIEKMPNLLNSLWPTVILSIFGIGFKNGLYIFMMRQFFKGVPDELEEASYVDGSGTFRTFFRVILPLSLPMMVTVFLFAFSWTWTDTFYSSMFYTNNFPVLANMVFNFSNVMVGGHLQGGMDAQVTINTAALLVIFPLVLFYCFAQKALIQGVERSGITG